MEIISQDRKLTPEEIREVILRVFKKGDKIHISKKMRKPIENAPVIFKGAYNNFIRIKAQITETYSQIYTISYTELYTGNTIIHEIEDQI